MPCPIRPIQVDERQPARADDLEVLARDGLTPPLLLDAPAVAHLDRLAPAGPPDGGDRARRVQLDLDRRVLPQQARHGTVSGRLSGRSSAAGAMTPGTSSAPRTAAPATGTHRQRVSASGASGSVSSIRWMRSLPNAMASLASCQSSRAPRAACGMNSGSC